MRRNHRDAGNMTPTRLPIYCCECCVLSVIVILLQHEAVGDRPSLIEEESVLYTKQTLVLCENNINSCRTPCSRDCLGR